MGDQAFVPAADRVVHGKIVVGAPVPQQVLALHVPVPFDGFPELVDLDAAERGSLGNILGNIAAPSAGPCMRNDVSTRSPPSSFFENGMTLPVPLPSRKCGKTPWNLSALSRGNRRSFRAVARTSSLGAKPRSAPAISAMMPKARAARRDGIEIVTPGGPCIAALARHAAVGMREAAENIRCVWRCTRSSN